MKSTTLAATILIAVAVAGCAHRNDGHACDGFKPQIVSEFTWAIMNEDERRQLVAHNEFGEKTCGWQPPES